MKKRVAINGFGRIGRVLTRLLINHPNLELVAVNDIYPLDQLGHLFKFDSTHGSYPGEVGWTDSILTVKGQAIPFYSEADPTNLPWKDLKIDFLVECTGRFKTHEEASKHLDAGAGRVVLSAPPSDSRIPTVVMGVNDDIIQEERIISNASCTTNNAAPMIKLIHELCEIESCYITTVHSYTGDQNILDAPHADLRRARAAHQSIIPTTTGAAKALTKIFPELSDAIGGCGIRVPVIDGSLTDITCVVKSPVAAEAINEAFKLAANEQFSGILEYSDESLVSRDIIGNSHSCVFDAGLTSVIGNMVKVVGWYDNEMGYSNRLVELLLKLQ